MILIGIVLLLLEGVLSNYAGYYPIYFPVKMLFTVFYLILLFYMKPKDSKKVFVVALILGVIYDICYTDIYFLHSIFYVLTLFFLKKIDCDHHFSIFKIFLTFTFYLLLEYLFGAIYQFTFHSLLFFIRFYLQTTLTNSIFFLLFLLYFYKSRTLPKYR